MYKKTYKKIFTVTKGGVFYLDKYNTVYDALDDNQLYYMTGPKRELENTIEPHMVVGISEEFVKQKIQDDTFIKESFSTKWGIRKVSNEELEKLKLIKLINDKAKKAANIARWWWTDPLTHNSYYVYACLMFDTLATVNMVFDHDF